MDPNLRLAAGWLLISALLPIGVPTAKAEQDRDSYILAVIPTAPPVVTHTLWVPFVERLSRDTGLGFRLKVYEKMSDFEHDISRGGPDFLFSSPLQAVVAHRTQGYVPLVRGGTPVSAGIFVRKDSPIRTVDDLSDKRIAFVGNKNLCSVFTRHAMSRQKSKIEFEQECSGSTSNVITSVLLGKADAGATFVTELEKQPEEVRKKIRLILETRKVAPHPLGVHPRVPPPLRETVREAVLALVSSAESAELLKTIRLFSPVAADYEKDYQSLEDVDIEGLSNWGE